VNCDLGGADLRSASLDHADLQDCVLDGAKLSNASLVCTTMKSTSAKRLILRESVIRDAVFDDVKLDGAFAAKCEFADAVFLNCSLDGATLDKSTMERCTFEAVSIRAPIAGTLNLAACEFESSQLIGWTIDSLSMRDCGVTNSRLEDWAVYAGLLDANRVRSCVVSNFDLGASAATCLDLSHSTVIATNVGRIGPTTAVLLDTAFVDCQWPRQAGRTSWSGRYQASETLLRHPVQDLKSLPPTVRREIADAQYLLAKLAEAKGMRRWLFRAWGLTSAYGQSLTRLVIVSALVIVAATIASLQAGHDLLGTRPDIALAARELGSVSLAFIGLAEPSNAELANGWQRAILAAVRGLGFVDLGIWIAIAATKISRLAGG
jgi:uncharacterized protein YjbI with pentapeptide repeats